MPERTTRRRRWPLVLTAALTIAGAGAVGTHLASAATTGCRVTYTVTNQWPGGFGANVDVTNLGDPVDGWRLTWTFPSGQTITQLWNGTAAQSGSAVTVTNAPYNAGIPTGATTNLGFNGSSTVNYK
jgi:cellulase/cellobiase CelA1